MGAMFRRSAYVLLLAALGACNHASDKVEAGADEGGGAHGGSPAISGASGLGGAGAGSGGSAAGRAAQGGAASGRGGAATSGGAGAGSAGRPSAGGTAGGVASGGVAEGGRNGSATEGGSGGRGGEVASAGSSELAGAGGEPNEPGSSCVDPFDTVDVSRLVADEMFAPYVVTGDTANQIRQSINQNRGMDYDAFTNWYVSWQFGDCDGHGLVVTVDVTYDFPEWQTSAGDSPELVASWDTYMNALFCHEYGHAEHALDCANDVFTALSTIDAGGDCSKQQSEAQAAFSPILDEYNQLDVQYDADTNHGASMGAVFPPP